MADKQTWEIVPMPTNEIRIITGLDADGDPIMACQFRKVGTEDENGYWESIDYLTGLGMLEGAKVRFIDHFDNEDED